MLTTTQLTGFGGRPGKDPYLGYTVFLSGFEGAAGSTVVTDESPRLRGTGTVFGSGTIVTTEKKFGTSSYNFDGTTRVQWPDSDDFDFGSRRFTVEAFIRLADITGWKFICTKWQTVGVNGWWFGTDTSRLSFVMSTNASDANNDLLSATGVLTAASWYHVAVDYDGSKYRMYVNGVMVASSTTPRNIYNSSTHFTVGNNDQGTGGFGFIGHIDEMRITTGITRYASDTGFVAPTAAFDRN